jgi:hypothetical protein
MAREDTPQDQPKGVGMEIRFKLTSEDQRIFVRHLRAGARNRRLSPTDALSVLAAAISGIGLIALSYAPHPDWRAVLLFAIAALFAMSSAALDLWRRFGHGSHGPEPWAGDGGIVLTPAGFSLASGQDARFVPWPDILACEETAGYFYLYFQIDAAFIVPKTAFPEPGQTQSFAEKVQSYWSGHPENRSRTLPDRPARVRSGLRLLSEFWANLRAGYCLAVFRPVDGYAFKAGGAALALLLGLHLLLSALGDYAAALPEPRFSVYGLAYHSTGVVLFLLSGLAVGGLVWGAANTLRLLTLIAAAEWMTTVFYRLLGEGFRHLPETAPPSGLWALFLVCLVWNFAIVFRAAGKVYRQSAPAALLLASVYALFNWGIGFYLPDGEFFYAYREEDAEQGVQKSAIDAEDVLYRQSRLLHEATEPLAAGRPGVTDLYFVGFAGQADEHVFANEIKYAKDLFDRRFDTAGRSVTLVNSPDTADRLPIANSHNLDSVLQTVAKRMNLQEDILFLFLTSHGSRDHRLSVQFWPLPLNDLPAAKLKELLDRSGIRHRVIVVSACYSGGFLDVLKDDNSLILTAASRDRTSFGCGVESEFTYFGDAFFAHALQDTRSFIDAFGKARQAIERREQDESKEPSMPQVHIGTAIVPKLLELERRNGGKS